MGGGQIPGKYFLLLLLGVKMRAVISVYKKGTTYHLCVNAYSLSTRIMVENSYINFVLTNLYVLQDYVIVDVQMTHPLGVARVITSN